MKEQRIRRVLLQMFALHCVVLFLAVSGVAQNTIHVPADQLSIQAAINVANNGDTVLVSAGTYTENINFSGKAITVTSASGPSVTIIDGGAKAAVVTFNANEGLSSVLNGFTIQHGNSSFYGGGIEISNASPTITGNIITNNHAICGIGIDVSIGSPLIQNNTITGNTQANGDGGCGGGGIQLSGGSSTPVIVGNTISNNSLAGGGFGGGISVESGRPTIQNNVIQGNYSYNHGGGLMIWSQSGVIVTQNIIRNNSIGGGGSGGGVAIYTGSNVSLINNTISGNSAVDHSAGIYVGSGTPQSVTIANNIVVVPSGQTAVVCDSLWSSLSPVFDHNDLYSASGTTASGVCDLSAPGSVSADPLFADQVSADLHLSTGSPAIDAGDTSVSQLSASDAAGDPRVVNGIVDMGAYEYQGATTFAVNPGALTFGPQNVGTSSTMQPVTVTNTGTYALHFHPLQIGADFFQSNNCSGPNGLAADQSCTVQVAFFPQAAGSKSEALTITGANSASNGNVSLSGQGAAPVASPAPTTLVFGNQALNTTSPAQMVTLTNVGGGSMTISAISTAGDFAVTHNCSTLSPGSSCTANVTFTPTATRARSGTLYFFDNASNSPQSVSLSGTGTGPEISFSPASVNFPLQPVGTSSTPQTLTVTNTGTAPLAISSIQVSGDYTATNTCSAAIAPAGTCSVTVTFHPTQYGSRPGLLSFTDNAAASPQTVALGGSGAAPVAYINPPSVTFSGVTIVGGQSQASSVLYENTGNSTLVINSISISGDFTQSNTCGSSLTPSVGCWITVTFTPTATGTRTGTLTLSDNASGSAHIVALNGQALASYPLPVLTSVSPTSIAVGSAGTVLTVTGSGFFPGSTIYWDGQALTTSYVSATALSATAPASASLAQHAVTVVNPAPGGGSSAAMQVTAYLSLPYSANDIVYDPYRQIFYASIEAASTSYPNGIITINPATGQTSLLTTISSKPDRLAVSNDGQFLWIGSDGDNTVKRFNLYTLAIDLVIPLGADPFLGPYIAYDLAPVPNAPHSVAVALGYVGISPPIVGVKIYDDGLARAAWVTSDTLSSIAFGSDSSTLYGTGGGISPESLIAMSVNSSGVTQTASASGAGGAELKFLGGLLYCLNSTNSVYNANDLSLAGSFSFVTPSVAWIRSEYPEPGTGLVYLMGGLSNGVGNPEIWAANASTYATTGSLILPNFGYSYHRLTRWGRDGLAFYSTYGGNIPTSYDQIVFVRSSITNPATSNNPGPAIASLSPPSATVGGANLQLVVNGSSFAPGAVVQWNGSDVTTKFVSSTELVAYIPSSDLAAATAASVTVLNLAPAGGASNAIGFSVQRAVPVITWPTPAAINYGTALSSAQLNAAASVPGTFIYTPAAESVLQAGTQTLSVAFTPTDTTDYAPVITTVNLTVNTVSPTVSGWPSASAIAYGQTLASSTLSNGIATVSGTFAFTSPTLAPALGTAGQSVTFTPADSTDYTAVTGTVMVTVNKATPTLTAWPSATAISYGQTLAASMLTGGSASVSGTFAFTNTTIAPAVGTAAQSVTFTPVDTTDYNTATGAVNVTVNKAMPVVTFTGAPATAPYQSKFTVAATTNAGMTATLTAAGACTISGTTVTITATSGICSLQATWAASANYLAASATQTTTPTKGTPILSWATPAAITYGTALSSTQLNATVIYNGLAIAGTFQYTPPARTVLNAGQQTLSVVFTPSSTNYNPVSGSVVLQVNAATPKITWAQPSAITYGTALGSKQLNASASVAGTFVYTPAAGTVLAAGAQTLSVTFNPTNITDYNSVTVTNKLTVNQASTTTTISSATPNPGSMGNAVTVAFSVAGVGVPAGTPAPTGSVMVKASTGESCSGSLTSGAGGCSLAFLTTGSRKLTATYSGDPSFKVSTSSAVSESVH